MAEIIWTDPAIDDLNNIAEYIAISNESAARKLVAEVFKITERLSEFPASGRIPAEISDLGYREVVVPPCRVFYKVEGDNVYILFVFRQEQDVRQYILSSSPA